MKKYDFLVIHNIYYLQYILEPNIHLYFIDINDSKLHCSHSKFNCSFFDYNDALSYQGKIKDMFGLEFQILREV